MGDATVLHRNVYVNHNRYEVVQLECSDGEEFRTKFDKIKAIFVGSNKTAADSVVNAYIKSTDTQKIVIDIKGGTTTDQKVSVVIVGDQ